VGGMLQEMRSWRGDSLYKYFHYQRRRLHCCVYRGYVLVDTCRPLLVSPTNRRAEYYPYSAAGYRNFYS
ncbi:hypothetical protein J6590_085655, partial [Homalodisca vitripennis]